MQQETLERTWNAAVDAVRQAREDAAAGRSLSRVRLILKPHEIRKGQGRDSYGADILHSLYSWRASCRNSSHGAAQYIAHVREAMRPVKLPVYRPAVMAAPVFDMASYASRVFGYVPQQVAA